MSRFVLIHGACHGAWCWERIIPSLRGKGHSVEAIDLPGSGDDNTPITQVTFQSYVDRIVAQVFTGTEPAILVGHSMGGTFISQAAETCYPRLTKLIYLCAVLPIDGETLVDAQAVRLSFGDPGAPEIWETGDDGTIFPKSEHARSAFYHRCTLADADAAIARLRPQSLQPFAAPVSLSGGGWEDVAKSYIICSDDQVAPPALQEWFTKRVSRVKSVVLDSDHSPFYSAPAALASILESEATTR